MACPEVPAGRWRFLCALAAVLCSGLTAVAASAQTPTMALVTEIAGLGERVPGAPGHTEARRFLRSTLESAGLAEVEEIALPGRPGLANLSGFLPGRDGSEEIVLVAHFDAVAGSPGALDNASGCAVVIRAAQRLAREPLQASLRVVLVDGEESGLYGATAYAAAATGASVRAILVLDTVGARGVRRAVLHAAPAGQPAAPWTSELLVGARQQGFPLEFADSMLPVPGQLLARWGRWSFHSDAGPLRAAGLPAILLSDAPLLQRMSGIHTPADGVERLDPERLEAWQEWVVRAVQTIDAAPPASLSARPPLVFAGRSIPDGPLRLLGAALLAGIAWRHRRRLRERGSELAVLLGSGILAWILDPGAATVLAVPALLVGVLDPWPRREGWIGLFAGLLPFLLLAAVAAYALAGGQLTGLARSALNALPALACALAAIALRWRETSLSAPSRRLPASPGRR